MQLNAIFNTSATQGGSTAAGPVPAGPTFGAALASSLSFTNFASDDSQNPDSLVVPESKFNAEHGASVSGDLSPKLGSSANASFKPGSATASQPSALKLLTLANLNSKATGKSAIGKPETHPAEKPPAAYDAVAGISPVPPNILFLTFEQPLVVPSIPLSIAAIASEPGSPSTSVNPNPDAQAEAQGQSFTQPVTRTSDGTESKAQTVTLSTVTNPTLHPETARFFMSPETSSFGGQANVTSATAAPQAATTIPAGPAISSYSNQAAVAPDGIHQVPGAKNQPLVPADNSVRILDAQSAIDRIMPVAQYSPPNSPSQIFPTAEQYSAPSDVAPWAIADPSTSPQVLVTTLTPRHSPAFTDWGSAFAAEGDLASVSSVAQKAWLPNLTLPTAATSQMSVPSDAPASQHASMETQTLPSSNRFSGASLPLAVNSMQTPASNGVFDAGTSTPVSSSPPFTLLATPLSSLQSVNPNSLSSNGAASLLDLRLHDLVGAPSDRLRGSPTPDQLPADHAFETNQTGDISNAPSTEKAVADSPVVGNVPPPSNSTDANEPALSIFPADGGPSSNMPDISTTPVPATAPLPIMDAAARTAIDFVLASKVTSRAFIDTFTNTSNRDVPSSISPAPDFPPASTAVAPKRDVLNSKPIVFGEAATFIAQQTHAIAPYTTSAPQNEVTVAHEPDAPPASVIPAIISSPSTQPSASDRALPLAPVAENIRPLTSITAAPRVLTTNVVNPSTADISLGLPLVAPAEKAVAATSQVTSALQIQVAGADQSTKGTGIRFADQSLDQGANANPKSDSDPNPPTLNPDPARAAAVLPSTDTSTAPTAKDVAGNANLEQPAPPTSAALTPTTPLQAANVKKSSVAFQAGSIQGHSAPITIVSPSDFPATVAASQPDSAPSTPTSSSAAPELPKTHQMLDAAPPAPATMFGLPVSMNPAGDGQMHVGIRTDTFGAVDIHTVVQQSLVGITVHGDRDIARWFSSEVASLDSGLSKSHLNLTSVDFSSGRSDAQAGSFQQGQPRQSFSDTPRTSHAALPSEGSSPQSALDTLPSSLFASSAVTRVSIHA